MGAAAFRIMREQQAKLVQEHEGAETSYDYAVRKIDGEGYKGRAKVVKDTKEQAENYLLEKDLDLDVWGIEPRMRK